MSCVTVTVGLGHGVYRKLCTLIELGVNVQKIWEPLR